ncbi:TPA: inovirus-type Gp2 protein [Vibrio vulnificus]
MTLQYPWLTVAHLDIRFQSNFDGDRSEVLHHFFHCLKSEAYELCLKENKHRPLQYHQTVICYV